MQIVKYKSNVTTVKKMHWGQRIMSIWSEYYEARVLPEEMYTYEGYDTTQNA